VTTAFWSQLTVAAGSYGCTYILQSRNELDRQSELNSCRGENQVSAAYTLLGEGCQGKYSRHNLKLQNKTKMK
jgi:hypothetical protein